MTYLNGRLLSAEDTFLSALSQGGDALATFEKSWESLMADVDLAMGSSDLDPETTVLIQTITSRIAMLAETSIELVELHDTFTSQFMNQLDSLMSELTLVDRSPRAPSSPSADILSTTSSTTSWDTHRRFPSLKRTRESDCLDSESSKRSCFRLFDRTPSKICSSRPLRPRSLSPGIAIPPSPISLSTSNPNNATVPLNANNRKRRLSESNASPSPSPFKRLYTGPRLHAVSDTFVPRAIAPIPKTTSSGISSLNDDISIPGAVAPLGTKVDEAHIAVQVGALSQSPLPTDFFLDSFTDSTWSQPPPSHDTHIDTLVQSICQIVQSSNASLPTPPNHGLVSPDTPVSDLSPASTPPYPSTPLLVPVYPSNSFDRITTDIGLTPNTLVGGANDCITFQLSAPTISKDPSVPLGSLAGCGGSEAYWDLFFQPLEPFNLPYDLSSSTLSKSTEPSFDTVGLAVCTDFE